MSVGLIPLAYLTQYVSSAQGGGKLRRDRFALERRQIGGLSGRGRLGRFTVRRELGNAVMVGMDAE